MKILIAAGLVALLGASLTHAQQLPPPQQLPPGQPPQQLPPGQPPTSETAPPTQVVGPPPMGCDASDGLGLDLTPSPRWIGPDRFWFGVDYLRWWTRGSATPPLATESTQTPTILGLITSSGSVGPGGLGAIGAPGTTVLFGGDALNDEARSGARFVAGFWFNNAQTIGLETTYFFLADQSTQFQASSSGGPVLARPFTNSSNNNVAQLLSVPPISVSIPLIPLSATLAASGSIAADFTTQFSGFEENAVVNLARENWYRFDLLAGVEFLQLNESLSTYSMTNATETGTLPGIAMGSLNVVKTEFEKFNTSNRFFGAEAGGRLDFNFGPVFVDLKGEMALGGTYQTVAIGGSTSTTTTVSGTVNGVISGSLAGQTVQSGGLLGPSRLVGQYNRGAFCAVPQFDLNVGYQFTPQWRALVGYNFLYMSNVVRPGEQIQSQPPINFSFTSTTFWAQGISVSMQFLF